MRYLIVIITSLLLLSCSAIVPEKKREAKQPIGVTVTVVGDSGGATEGQSYSGTLTENYATQISFHTGGKLTKVYVNDGDSVKRGDKLAEVDKTQAINALNNAEATLAQARDGYRRLKLMHDSGSISEVKWVEMQTKLKQAQAMKEIAIANLNECTVRAPFKGKVCNKKFGIGTHLLPSQSFMEIMNTDTMLVKVAIPENDIAAVTVGDLAYVQVLSAGSDTIVGKIVSKEIDADNVSHTYDIKVSIPNPDGALLSGMVCKVTILKSSLSDGCVIPYQSVQLMQDGRYVWCVENGRTTRRHIVTSRFTNNGIMVIDGLHKGDSVVVDGRQKVYEGAEVVIN